MPVCSACGSTRHVSKFRRWRGTKWHLGTVCLHCKPEKKAHAHRSLTGEDLRLLVKYGRANPVLVAQIKEERRQRQFKERTAAKAVTRARRIRRVNWEPVMDVLRDELAYARRKVSKPGQMSDIPQWSEFWVEYVEVLESMVAKVTLHILTPGMPLKPTMEQTNPAHWITEAEFFRLRNLYSVCTPIPGVRFRSPAFSGWYVKKEK